MSGKGAAERLTKIYYQLATMGYGGQGRRSLQRAHQTTYLFWLLPKYMIEGVTAKRRNSRDLAEVGASFSLIFVASPISRRGGTTRRLPDETSYWCRPSTAAFNSMRMSLTLTLIS